MRFERRISNIQFPMSNEATKTLKYDLEERTAKFGEAIVDFAKLLTRDTVTTRARASMRHWKLVLRNWKFHGPDR